MGVIPAGMADADAPAPTPDITAPIEPEDVFTVTFTCRNCGTVWEQHHGEQIRVEHSNAVMAVVSRDTTCREFGMQCECCEAVTCPTCQLRDPVKVTDRAPITTESDEEGADGA